MEFQLKDHIPADFHPSSRVWIYQSSRRFGFGEALELDKVFTDFIQQWNSHGTPVKGYANLFFGQFIVIMADETATGVSGCSTDSSVRMIKSIEDVCKVQLFDRQMLAFLKNDKVELLPLAQLPYAIEKGYITAETTYFNNLVSTKAQLMEQWLQPVQKSWLAQRFPMLAATTAS